MHMYNVDEIDHWSQPSIIQQGNQRKSYLSELLFSRFSDKIPVTFMTGFYFANVYARYWDQFTSLPKPDKLAYKLMAFVQGQVNQFYFPCLQLLVKVKIFINI